MLYRVTEYDSGFMGMPGMGALINEWAGQGLFAPSGSAGKHISLGAVLFLEQVHFLPQFRNMGNRTSLHPSGRLPSSAFSGP